MKEFSTFSLARLLKTNRSVIQLWLDRKMVQPSINQASGVGTKSLFSVQDLYRIFLFKALYEAGLPQKEASAISGEVNLENVSDEDRFIILKRKRLENGKFATTHFLKKIVTADEINSGEALEMTIIIDGLKLKSLVESSI